MTGFSLEKLSAFLVDGAMGMVWIGFWYIAVVTGCIELVPMLLPGRQRLRQS
jgi:hypothetical protein